MQDEEVAGLESSVDVGGVGGTGPFDVGETATGVTKIVLCASVDTVDARSSEIMLIDAIMAALGVVSFSESWEV